nr:immunoglobulin light chain junction region [Macaca mulatta]MOV61553.1 immunoglobulin light chain junction region [Macaca mulatta]MOV63897.1 immunoglobulin light chain junction region [Macaca mulatta]MOV65009.1 immunoglobulin light chain junction region [Macaca mulatta]MOV65667.1 immunoglobulin light chain junction region [Macaca mulatta]
CMQGLEFPHSF